MQVFCGITTDHRADPPSGHGDATCAVALVVANGGLLATDTFTDDPRGWVRFACLLARQAKGAFPVTIAIDGEVGPLAEFAAASGNLVVQAHSPSPRSKDALDSAVALARGLATGEVRCDSPYSVGAEIAAMRPILDTVFAAAKARHDAAEALTCLLRAVFPAALAAWDDPSETNAVAILSRLPQPGAIQSISTEDLAADLATIADPGQVAAMAGALTEAIREIGGGDDPTVAPSVAATAEAVAAWDRSLEGLVGLLQARRPRREAANALRTDPPRDFFSTDLPPSDLPAEQPSEGRRRRRSVESHRTVRLPGDLPDRESLRSLDPASQMHSLVSPDLEATQVLPDDRGNDDTASTRSIRRRRAEPVGLPSTDPSPGLDEYQPPMEALGDDDSLLIFGQAKSAWFKRPEGEDPDTEAWQLPGDEGWRTARHVTDAPEAEESTTPSGLPRRKPQANLVPGSVLPEQGPVSDEPIERDAELLAHNTAGYFKGWGRARGGSNPAGRRSERMAAR